MILRPRAYWDLEDASSWYNSQQDGLGTRFLANVNECLRRINDNPYLYAIVRKDARCGRVAKFPFGVYYRIVEGKVVVFGILHTSRSVQVWKSRVDREQSNN